MDRVRRLKLLLWAVLGLAAAVAVVRYRFGLGQTTNLGDANPWGLWIGFDVLGGVALAAGGFIVAAAVYIFRLERFHAVVRPAILTAFLGYAAVAMSLGFDLGLPWNIWHMIVYWNPHSPLFEVGWCVMLYLTVLGLEFLPVPAESFPRLARLRTALLKARLPLVILGIGLSTLHQSSLGSLFLIMPYRLHPLWYSPLLPLLFLASAIALGMEVVVFESHATSYLYRRRAETDVLRPFGRAARWVLGGYAVLRLTDLGVRGELSRLVAPGALTLLFWLELLLMLAPVVLFSSRRLTATRRGQWIAATVGILGILLNRIDVGGLAHVTGSGSLYVPSWSELALSAGLLAGLGLVFLVVVERFHVWEERPADPLEDPTRLPELDPVGGTWLGVPAVAARTTHSLAFVSAAALGFALLPGRPAEERGAVPTPVHQARGGDELWIDGNLDGFGVAFKHAEHVRREGGKDSCVRCHHFNLPHDRNTVCARCHGDMYRPVDAFRHDWHASPEGGRVRCGDCHRAGEPRSAATAVRCDRCHKDLQPPGAKIAVKRYRAAGYAEAMHGLCIGCHVERAPVERKSDMPRCRWCHKGTRDLLDAKDVVLGVAAPEGRRIVLPVEVVRSSLPGR